MFYDQFVKLCKERGMSPAAVTKEIGLNNSSSTAWKRGSIPKGDTLQKLADYFGVSVDYLLGKEKLPTIEPFKVGDSFLGDRLKVTKVENNGDGTLNVSFSVDNDGMTADELTQILNTIGRMSEETGVQISDIAQFTAAMSKAIQSAVVKKVAQVPTATAADHDTPQPPAPQEGKDTPPAPDAPETPPEGE